MLGYARTIRVLALLLVLLPLVPSGLSAAPNGAIKTRRLTFKGVTSVDTGRLKAALATKESSILPWGKKYEFDRSKLETDLKRIEAFYADRGYPDAHVTGSDAKLNHKQDAVDITVTVSEGEPVKVVAMNFVGFEVIPPTHLADLEKRAPLKVGQPRDRQLVTTVHDLAINELRDHGFPYAKVTTTEDDGPGGKQASLSFVAEPRKVAHFGTVEITGNKSVSDHVISRELAYKPGDLYQRSLLQDTQRRLYGMELFQFANVQPLNQDAEPSDAPTRITVAEGKHQRVNFGVGYGSEEKERVDAEYHELNFLGGARTAGVHVRWSALDRGARLDFNQPYLFAPHFSLGAEIQHWDTFTPAYNSVVNGGKITVTHRSSARTSWSISMTSEHDSSAIAPDVLGDLTLRNSLIALGLDPRTNEQTGTLNAVGFDFRYSTADSLLNAHRGYQITFHAEQAGRIVPGTFNYDAIAIDGRYYVPISDRFVLATRMQAGDINPADNLDSNIPFSKKYFLGGATSVRGWGTYELSPLSEGLPIGGDSMAEASIELRAAIHGSFGGVIFIDAGNVWAQSWGFNLEDLRYAIGSGLRYQTPIGPVRFDFGYQLNPISGLLVNGLPETRQWRVHFSIGQAF